MAKKTAKRVKHVPQRTCVGCRQTLAKRSLIRIVRAPEGLRVDPTGKLPGRGAYLHDQRTCWESGLKGPLAHALKVELTNQDRETLRAFMAALPEEAVHENEAALQIEAQPPKQAKPQGKAKPVVKKPTEKDRKENEGEQVPAGNQSSSTLGNAL